MNFSLSFFAPAQKKSTRISGLILSLAMVPGFLGSSTESHASWATEVETEVRAFYANSVKYLRQLPIKYDSRTGMPKRRGSRFFSEATIASGDYVLHKDSVRRKLCKRVHGNIVCLKDVRRGRAPFESNDLAENLVDSGDQLIRSLTEMDRRGLRQGSLAESPWSDSYWPIYLGELGQRYSDASFPHSSDWKANQTYVSEDSRSPMKLFGLHEPTAIDNLSPSEKYDLLVGDSHGTLTQAMWSEGESYFSQNGSVENWMGICHGWAPASYMYPRPKKTIQLTAADGRTPLNFYPADIKALGSLLWAKAQTESRFVGGRCNDKNPKTDENGRVRSEECFDTNPGTWHQAVVNQIGISKRGFVIDATYDYEVWNQPVFAYRYTYFNPQTQVSSDDLNAAWVATKDFSKDKFKRYRGKNTAFVVGVAMDVTYIEETDPTHLLTDSPSNDAPKTVRYLYDLELDQAANIIGGEWYMNAHPDFIWTPEPNARALSAGDRLATTAWNGSGKIPETWRKGAAAASRAGMPLARIVELLMALSSQ